MEEIEERAQFLQQGMQEAGSHLPAQKSFSIQEEKEEKMEDKSKASKTSKRSFKVKINQLQLNESHQGLNISHQSSII